MPPQKASTAFTLVEMLVSITVLALLILLIAQLFNSATATATLSRKHIDADEEARAVLDRMGSDLARMVRRPDVNYIFCKNAGTGTGGASDAMFFYSEGPGYLSPGATAAMATTSGSASTMALVGFRINASNTFYPGIPVMERLGENLTWGGSPDTTGTIPGGMVFLTNPVTAISTLAGNWTYTLGPQPYNTGASLNDTSHYQLLSDMVFRMEFCFLLKSGTYALASGTTAVTGSTGYSNVPTAISTTIAQPYVTSNYSNPNGGTYPGGSWQEPPGNVYGFPPDLGGIVVTIAVLDSTSRKTVPSNGLSTLAGALGDSPSGSTAAQLWQSQLQGSGFAQSLSIPQTAIQQVRVYERTFYLDAN